VAATLPTLDEVEALIRRLLDEKLDPIRRALPPSLVSIEDAAGILGVSVATVRRRVKAREYPTKRVGRQIKIDATALHPEREAEIVDLAARVRAR
jgi:excisionase family DNA binding protein